MGLRTQQGHSFYTCLGASLPHSGFPNPLLQLLQSRKPRIWFGSRCPSLISELIFRKKHRTCLPFPGFTGLPGPFPPHLSSPHPRHPALRVCAFHQRSLPQIPAWNTRHLAQTWTAEQASSLPTLHLHLTRLASTLAKSNLTSLHQTPCLPLCHRPHNRSVIPTRSRFPRPSQQTQ